MAQIKFYLEKRGDRETKVPILLSYSFHGQRLIYYTGLRVDKKYYVEKYWTGNGKQPIKATCPDCDYLNNQIAIMKAHLGAAENEAKAAGTPLSVEYFRDYLNTKLKEKPETQERITLLLYFDRFIGEMKNGINQKTGHRLSHANVEKYSAVKNMLVEFGKHRGKEVDFADMDKQLYNELINYMITEKKYALNTYGRHIKFIKTVLHKATSDGINTNIKFQKAFVGVTEQSDNAYLTETELEQLYNHDFSKKPYLDRVRDIFLIGCWTGLRFSDYTNLKHENIEGDKIKIIQQKTKKPVIIPINDTVKAILQKYDYQLPKAISNQKFNDYLQKVCTEAKIEAPFTKSITRAGKVEVTSGKKHDFISSHSARRTFSSNMFKRGVPPYLIMTITGHKTETEFLKYLKVTAEERAEMFAAAANWQKKVE